MKRLDEYLIPTRFLCLMGHFIAVLLAWSSRNENIKAALPLNWTSSQYDEHEDEYRAAFGMAIGAFCVEFLGLFSGLSLFVNAMSTVMIALHFCGGMLVTWYITDEWDFRNFWYLSLFFSFVPAVLEVIQLFRIVCCKSMQI